MSRRPPWTIATRFVGVLTAALLGASAAVAYWTTTGSGHASSATGVAQAITLSPGTPSSQLFPGGTGDVALTVSNPNAFQIHVGSLSLNAGQGTAGVGVDSGHSGCVTSALTFTRQTNGGAGWTVPPKVGATNGSLPLDISGALALSAAAARACQGASFDVYLTAGP